MAAPELFHSLPEPSHLLDTLTSLGHPYGLLLAQQGSSHQSAESSIQSDHLLPSSQESVKSGEWSKYPLEHPQRTTTGGHDITDVCIGSNILCSGKPAIASSISLAAPLIALGGKIQFSGMSLESLGSGSIIPRSCVLEDKTRDESAGDISAISSSIFIPLSLSHGIAPLYVEGKHSKAQAKNIPLALIAPFLAKITQPELTLPRSKELHIGKRDISFGTASLRLSTYRGTEPFVVKSPSGESVAEIQPGDPIAALHVSHQAAQLRGLSPLEKVHAIIDDMTHLFATIDQTDPNSLDEKQRQTLETAQDATILGISHLVRLFRRATGLPTWKLDVLPEILQRFHTLDSQLVSNQFGGRRRVKPEDVEMLVITPSQRHQLTASLA